MRTEDGKHYQEEPKDVWTHKKSGVVVIKVSTYEFTVRVPNRESRDICGDDAEARAFLIAGMFIDQLKR